MRKITWLTGDYANVTIRQHRPPEMHEAGRRLMPCMRINKTGI